ncbi:MAG: hypothetical protein ABJA34_00800 [Pseudonocardiales bacterium]
MTDYEGRTFRPVDAGQGDQPTAVAPATGHYHQDGDVVSAEFAGGEVRAGRLIGTVQADGTIDGAYCLLTAETKPVAGACRSTPTVLADGRIRLTEQWQRLDGSSGVSHVEEVAP